MESYISLNFLNALYIRTLHLSCISEKEGFVSKVHFSVVTIRQSLRVTCTKFCIEFFLADKLTRGGGFLENLPQAFWPVISCGEVLAKTSPLTYLDLRLLHPSPVFD